LVRRVRAGTTVARPTPISKVPEQDRTIMSEEDGEPQEAKLTKAAEVYGFKLAAGSVLKVDGENYQIQTAGPLTVKEVNIPAGSWIELKRDPDIVFGDSYLWNGVVHIGSSPKATLSQVRIKTARAIDGAQCRATCGS
jgi:hypothetical protein